MDWSESTTTAQRNWLGRSEGAELVFPIGGPADRRTDGPTDEWAAIRVYTTRADTVFGATFMVLAPEHPLVDAITAPDKRAEVEAYRRAAASKDLVSRKVGDREKTGVFTGGYAVNPATGQPIPVWVADYVLMEYGTGAIMAVPGHDERDFEFARKFGLEIVRVVAPAPASSRAERGILPAEADAPARRGLHRQRKRPPGQLGPVRRPAGARSKARRHRLARGARARARPSCATGSTTGASPASATGARRSRSSTATSTARCRCRRRTCRLSCPRIEDFAPDDSGISPLARYEKWYHVPCPVCGKRARRETDVSDTFLDSAWYHLRYPQHRV